MMRGSPPSRFPLRPDYPQNEKGVALVLVLWMLMLLSLVANSVSLTARTEAQIAANLVSQAHAEAAADASIFKAIAELSAPIGTPGRWQGNGMEYRWAFDGLDVHIRIRSESAKVDLNEAPPALLAGLFRAIGHTDADALADAIVDWRDRDSLRRLHGAEHEDYSRVGKTYGPANARFESVEELGLVLGIDNETFHAAREFVTVHSSSGAIDAALADRPILLALPGATPEQVDAYIARRRAALDSGLPSPSFVTTSGSAPAMSDYYSVRATAYSGDNTHFSREAVVRLTGNPSNPFVILAWRALISDNAQAADTPIS